MAPIPPRLKFRLTYPSPYPCNMVVSKNTLNSPYEVHFHECAELAIVLSGTATHLVCGREYHVGPGDVFVINPDVMHGFPQACNFVSYNITYMKDNLESMCGELRQMPGYQSLFILGAPSAGDDFLCRLKLFAEDLQWAGNLVEMIKKEKGRLQPGCELLVRSYFIELVVGLSRLYGHGVKTHPESERIDRMADLASHLERHFLEPISCEEMSRIASVSDRQLRRLFAKYYHTSPFDYVLRLRLQRAAAQLVSSGKTVAEVAFSSGFNDSNYFCRQFRKMIGLSPVQYRKRQG
jgi:AraC-like DNA-binding protein